MRGLTIILLLFASAVFAQPEAVVINNGIIGPVSTSIPAMEAKRFIEITRAWAYAYTRNSGGYDASNVTNSSITISAFKRNAFNYQNTGERVDVKIRYNLVIDFTQDSYTIKFVVQDIYGDNNNLLSYKLPDYYKPDGTLKDGYTGLDTSLEKTVNEIIESHYSYVANYK